MVLQLALVLGLVFLLPRISVGLATFLFLLYSATVGVTFAFIFELYTTQSIFTRVPGHGGDVRGRWRSGAR